jgi:hypothetical protein
MTARIERPLVILGAPRSGTTILRNALARHPDVWHLVDESHRILEGPFDPAATGYRSNRVEGGDVTDALARRIHDEFAAAAINLHGREAPPARVGSVHARLRAKLRTVVAGAASKRHRPASFRFLEKTPKNTLRVPMLERVFPDALYVHLTRDVRGNVDSLIEGWRATDVIGPVTRERFARSGYPIADQVALSDYDRKWWKFALVPGWRELRGKTLADVAAWQYLQCNRFALDDLRALDPARVRRVTHEDIVRSPVEVVRDIVEWAGLPPSPEAESYAGASPRVNSTRRAAGTSPDALRNADAAEAAITRTPGLDALLRELGYG